MTEREGASTTGLWRWYEQRAGRQYLASERTEIDAALANLFGYHLLQVGCPASVDLLGVSRIGHCVRMDDSLRPHGGNLLAGLYARFEAIPIRTDCIDLVFLPHTLEISSDPHRLLREVDRILVPEGHVVVLGFNPWSPWGFAYYVLRRWRKELSGIRPRSPGRIVDWLGLLGFDILCVRRFHYRPVWGHAGVMRRLAWIEALGGRCLPFLGSGYLIVARKKVTALTPLRRRRRRRRRFIPSEAAKPAHWRGPWTRS